MVFSSGLLPPFRAVVKAGLSSRREEEEQMVFKDQRKLPVSSLGGHR